MKFDALRIKAVPVAICLAAAASLLTVCPVQAQEESASIQKTSEVDLGSLIRKWASEMEHVYAETRVEQKDNSNLIFDRLGIKDPTFKQYVSGLKKDNPFANAGAGRLVQARLTPKGEVLSVRIFAENDSSSDKVSFTEIARADTGKFKLANKISTFDITPVAVSAVVKTTLEQAAKTSKIPQNVVGQLKKQLAESFDLKAVKKGDTFNLVYEKRQLDGAFLGTGKLLAMEYYSGGKKKAEAFWFESGDVHGYYNDQGDTVEKTFLSLPCEAHLTSPFNQARKHPITGKYQPHLGIDLAAPPGTPIYAASDGEIIVKKAQSTGYGNMIEIDHGLGYETRYAHLRGFAPNINQGMRVRKGQLIGYVGSTGLATGPHLHYEIKRNGIQINPYKADLKTGGGLRADLKQSFLLAIIPLKYQLSLLSKVQLALNDSR